MSKPRIESHVLETVANKSVIPVEAPDKILLVPWGQVRSAHGGFVIDQQAADEMMSAFEQHGVLLPVDMEHQTLGGEYSSPNGAAPAMGWITSLAVEVGRGIVGSVEWTEEGMAFVQKKAYRYLSPVVRVRRSDRRGIQLHSVALTNKPAIVGMERIANSDNTVPHMSKFGSFEGARLFLGLDESANEEKIMDEMELFLSKLRDLVQVADGATQTEVMAALTDRFKQGDDLRLAVCKALDVKMDDDAGSWEGIGENLAAFKVHSDKGESISRTEFDVVAKSLKETQSENKALSEKITDREAAERIELAMSEGKLTEDMVKPDEAGNNHFLALARSKKDWDQFINRQPVVKPPKGSALSGNNQRAPAARSGQGDTILANSDRYDPDRIGEYGRIKAYQKEHKVGYEEAMEACGA